LNPLATYPDDFILQVENSRAGGPWEVLAADLKDSCFFVDDRKRNYNKYMNECYRLRLMSMSTGENLVSGVVNAGSYGVYPFSAEAENVIKQVEKDIELSGCEGVLLKKKHWGTRCPDCTDFDDQGTVNEHCPRCLGTGFDGGFYQGISMSIKKEEIKAGEKQGEDCVEKSEIISARCVAYPWVRYGDVWVEKYTNKRFFIDKVSPTSTYKHVDLVYGILMHRIEYNDVMYTPIADAKVDIKDLYYSAQVDYTPTLEKDLEDNARYEWEKDLDL
jgi:hypothetical protein